MINELRGNDIKRDSFIGVCDLFLDRFKDLQGALGPGWSDQSWRAERSTAMNRPTGPTGMDPSSEVERLSHELARDLLAEVPSCGGTRAASALLHQHPLHSQVVMQSAVMRHALAKPRGYAGDMDLMLMLCDGLPRGATRFARAVNDVFVRVPAAQAVRDRVAMLHRLLGELPADARVLNLACGPALEVQRLFTAHPDRPLRIDLVDHDPHTLSYLRQRLPRHRARLLAGNAFRILAGDLAVSPAHEGVSRATVLAPGYDLIYSAGLFDYIPGPSASSGGAPRLTQVLFSLLKPGGLLLIGNYLKPTATSAHRPHVQAMMELYSQWHLRYRSADEIAGFASTINTPHTVNLIDENGHALHRSPRAVIGFTAIRAA